MHGQSGLKWSITPSINKQDRRLLPNTWEQSKAANGDAMTDDMEDITSSAEVRVLDLKPAKS